MSDFTVIDDITKSELAFLREIERLLRTKQDTFLTKIVPDDCNCNRGKSKKIHTCKEAFEISIKLKQLDKLRGG